MPIYIYQCDRCGITFERRQHIGEPPLTKCPKCGGHVHRLIQPVGIIFKGPGFYVTDNRAASSTTAPAKSKSKDKEAKGATEAEQDSVDHNSCS